MQKLNFLQSIENIKVELKSEEIIEIFRKGFKNPDSTYDFQQINPLLFTSKSRYDILSLDNSNYTILKNLGGDAIYNENNLSLLTSLLKPATAYTVLVQSQVIYLFTFHNTLLNLHKSGKALLTDEDLQKSFEDSLKIGLIIFKIIIPDNGLSPSDYSKILVNFDELIKIIDKIKYPTQSEDEMDEHRIVYLDSGSDTNIGIKSKIETAKALFQIFKEIWDYIVNRNFYVAKQKNEALLDSLTIRKEINKMATDNVITIAEAKKYSFLVKSRADSLIGMKVLPKELLESEDEITNKDLLLDYKELKLLENSEDN